ncbi:gamma-glutamyl-gamma-aminobutyrate hydrolase family protein [Helicobacter sp. MIT 21-1697]|uniref:gamma-glutamyl-CDP-amidate hydrolase n=1 Tax=Helicobacter sp. MIT 21-1697 TaxID=2993733 RepID=UPI00224B6F01|nr:gamma-glutamyl-CDP-amidate hydrolase [Helicobacter sp. MIT 21-1697]MCX2717432.1 gamma-glutamyl-gamma-aminobutyrate hydrolase family protein [Helicobacter sp. MIT 21-1697]
MKFIALTQRLLENTSYYELREALSVEWGAFFKEHLQGFLPLPLSYAIPFSIYAKSLGNSLGGVLLSGGNDLNSLNPNPLSLRRDEYEAQIITHCMQHNVPLLGICRGAQMIAEYFSSQLELLEGHIGNHQVFNLRNGDTFEVNSFHNYGIRTLGECLEPLILAQDKSIEAFKHKQKPIFALMWHIERTLQTQGKQAENNGLINNEVIREWKKLIESKEK